MSNVASIIIPVYNSEKSLEKLLMTLITQTYHNIEICMIDDGSTDSSSIIIKKHMEKDKRIKYFYQENKGVSSARNLGLEMSTGKYCCFVDADDYLDSQYVFKLVEGIERKDVDMCISSYTYINEKNEPLYSYKDFSNNYLKKYDFINNILERNKMNSVLWNKIFKREIIEKNNLRFDTDILIGEDFLFIIEYIINIDRFYYIEDRLYYYNVSSNGILNEKKNNNSFNLKWYTEFDALDKIKNILIDNNLYDEVKTNYVHRLVSVINKLLFLSYYFENDSHPYLEKMRDVNKKQIPYIIFNKNYNIKFKIMTMLYTTMPKYVSIFKRRLCRN
ncbi:glycosyltransferase [Vagococcus lutrae]|uniref:glycosyltransferase n=1 Tax=Vagococcus lutrae TaxID=81947 RepID=UPI0023A92E34|nr:glycosyltransferase [Vagococcus lutrae]WEB81770.1 glycosyltransferase [Vagococcus lutrae]